MSVEDKLNSALNTAEDYVSDAAKFVVDTTTGSAGAIKKLAGKGISKGTELTVKGVKTLGKGALETITTGSKGLIGISKLAVDGTVSGIKSGVKATKRTLKKKGQKIHDSSPTVRHIVRKLRKRSRPVKSYARSFKNKAVAYTKANKGRIGLGIVAAGLGAAAYVAHKRRTEKTKTSKRGRRSSKNRYRRSRNRSSRSRKSLSNSSSRK
jgi:hypothetical protein